MKQKIKDRLVEWAVVLMFVVFMSGCVYYIIRIMTRWKVKGLG